MEKLSEIRRSEEETYLWSTPFRFLDQILKAIFQCLGLLHRDSSTTTKTATSSATLNQQEEEEEEEVVVMEEEVVVTTRGFKNGVVMSSSRGIKVKAKKKDKERHSSGAPGKHG